MINFLFFLLYILNSNTIIFRITEEEVEGLQEKLKKTERKLKRSEQENEEIVKEWKEKYNHSKSKLQILKNELDDLRARPPEVRIEERIINNPPQILEKPLGISFVAHERKIFELREDIERISNEAERWKKLTYELDERIKQERNLHDAEILAIKRQFMI